MSLLQIVSKNCLFAYQQTKKKWASTWACTLGIIENILVIRNSLVIWTGKFLKYEKVRDGLMKSPFLGSKGGFSSGEFESSKRGFSSGGGL